MPRDDKTVVPESPWCPTMKGEYRAYMPQWKKADTDKWENVEVGNHPLGVPQPIEHGGVNSTIGLFGYEQALALAWSAAAIARSQPGCPLIEVRAQAHEVHYEIRARVIEDDATPT